MMPPQHRPPAKSSARPPRRVRKPKRPSAGARKPLQPKDLLDIAEDCRKKWGWDFTLKEGQVEAIKAQLEGRDVVVHAATGYGKTCIAAGPHVHPQAAGRVTIMVSPLIGLQEEMVSRCRHLSKLETYHSKVDTFRDEFKLNPVAVNSSHGGCTPETLQRIVSGEYNMVLISPELLLSKDFIDVVLRDISFTDRVLSFVVDEAHVVSHWGADFRKQYGSLGMVRAFLPHDTSVVALSATLPERVRRDVLTKLQFGSSHVRVDAGNNRPNVALVVRAIEHPLNSFRDLDFVIPSTTTAPMDIPLTWIYADSITAGVDIEDHLTTLLPPALRTTGLIRPYNAAHSKEYQAEAMRMVRAGTIRVLICTDAAGMGCNLPNIDVVVQWKLPATLSTWIQRAGRAARGQGHQGLAVLLVEPSAFETDLWANREDEDGETKSKGKGKMKQKSKRTRAEITAYARARGALRGSTAKTDVLTVRDQPPIDPTDPKEGLIALVQTTECRRKVIQDVYKNRDCDSMGRCCDLCNPQLLDRTRPGVFKARARRSAVKKGEPSVAVQAKLDEWRTCVKRRDHPGVMWSAEALLQRDTMVLLSSVGPIRDRRTLDQVLAGQWTWMERYGDELLQLLQSFAMPALVKKSANPRKRKADAPGQAIENLEAPSARAGPASKRPRTDAVTPDGAVVRVAAAHLCAVNAERAVVGSEMDARVTAHAVLPSFSTPTTSAPPMSQPTPPATPVPQANQAPRPIPRPTYRQPTTLGRSTPSLFVPHADYRHARPTPPATPAPQAYPAPLFMPPPTYQQPTTPGTSTPSHFTPHMQYQYAQQYKAAYPHAVPHHAAHAPWPTNHSYPASITPYSLTTPTSFFSTPAPPLGPLPSVYSRLLPTHAQLHAPNPPSDADFLPRDPNLPF